MTVDDEGDDLTDAHMQLLQWLDEHPTGSLTAAAQALGLEVEDVEVLCADLAELRQFGHRKYFFAVAAHGHAEGFRLGGANIGV